MASTPMQLSQVEEYMRYRKLPQDIRKRVQEFYEHRYRKKFFNEELILQELSVGLAGKMQGVRSSSRAQGVLA